MPAAYVCGVSKSCAPGVPVASPRLLRRRGGKGSVRCSVLTFQVWRGGACCYVRRRMFQLLSGHWSFLNIQSSMSVGPFSTPSSLACVSARA